MEWATESGKTYQVQYKNDLNDLSWQLLGGPLTNYPSATFTDTLGTNGQRFYRIVGF